MLAVIWVLWIQYTPGPLVRVQDYYQKEACEEAKREMVIAFSYARAHCLRVEQ